MLSIVMRPFQAERSLQVGEVVDTTGWRNTHKLMDQKRLAVAGVGTDQIPCACGRRWSEARWAKEHYKASRCKPAPVAEANKGAAK